MSVRINIFCCNAQILCWVLCIFALTDCIWKSRRIAGQEENARSPKKNYTSTSTREFANCFRALTLVCPRGIEVMKIQNGSCHINIGSLYPDKRNVPPSLHQYPTYKRKASGKAGRYQHSICRKNKYITF